MILIVTFRWGSKATCFTGLGQPPTSSGFLSFSPHLRRSQLRARREAHCYLAGREPDGLIPSSLDCLINGTSQELGWWLGTYDETETGHIEKNMGQSMFFFCWLVGDVQFITKKQKTELPIEFLGRIMVGRDLIGIQPSKIIRRDIWSSNWDTSSTSKKDQLIFGHLGSFTSDTSIHLW